jgi:putative copper export protein
MAGYSRAQRPVSLVRVCRRTAMATTESVIRSMCGGSKVVSDTVQDVNQVVHNVGMAAWVGGTMFGRLAHNPSLSRISSHAERGAVANAAWNAYNVVNLGSATASASATSPAG